MVLESADADRKVYYSPNTLEVHGSNLHHVSDLLGFEDAISSTSGHASNIQEFGAIDEMVV